MKRNVFATGLVVLALSAAPALAAHKLRLHFNPLDPFLITQDQSEFVDGDEQGGLDQQGDYPISAREAAMIAKQVYPNARVLKVRLLPSGIYAVTLRGRGRLTRVMVDAKTGNLI